MVRFFAILMALFPAFLGPSSYGQTLPGIHHGILLLSACEPTANAGSPVPIACGSEPAMPGSKVTFLDLARKIPETRKNLGQMYLGEEAAPSKPGEPPSAVPEGDFSYLSFSSPQKSTVAILESRSGTLAYFQVLPTLKALDAVGISQDQMVSLAPELGVYSAKSGELLFWTNNAHHNAGESFNIYNLIRAGDRIDIAYDGPFLYSFNEPDSDCSVMQRLAPVKSLSNDALGYPILAMQALQEKICQKNGKDVVVATRKFEATLQWDKAKAKYMGGSKELFQLNRCRVEGKTHCS